MGCSESRIADVIPEETELTVDTGRFNSYLALLPYLFSEYQVANDFYLIAAYVSPDFKTMVFACMDTNANYYEKIVLEEELIRTRNRLNVNGRVSSGQFLTALRNAFYHNKISLFFDEEDDEEYEPICKFNIEFHFAALGGPTSLQLLLTKVEQPYERISEIILFPLYQHYHSRTNEGMAELESEIERYEELIARLENGDTSSDEADKREEEGHALVEESPRNPESSNGS